MISPEEHEPRDLSQMKIPAMDWAFYTFSRCAHEETAPMSRPITPLPCGHVPQGLCDDCPTCMWYLLMDWPFWGEKIDPMSDDEIREWEIEWSQPFSVVAFTDARSG